MLEWILHNTRQPVTQVFVAFADFKPHQIQGPAEASLLLPDVSEAVP